MWYERHAILALPPFKLQKTCIHIFEDNLSKMRNLFLKIAEVIENREDTVGVNEQIKETT